VGKKYPLPDVYLVWTVLPNPLLRARHVRDLLHAPPGVAPILSLCKTDHDLDVTYPNMYFRTLGWWTKVTRGLNQAALSMPFAKRKPRMWWRGSSGITWPAARPRVLSVSRWFMKSWADFAFTNMWTSVWRRWRRNQWRVHVPRNAMAIPFGGEKRTPIHAVARFRYTLHLPGSFSGTYSRALQFLLWTGTTIFFYDCPYYEFYYHHLEVRRGGRGGWGERCAQCTSQAPSLLLRTCPPSPSPPALEALHPCQPREPRPAHGMGRESPQVRRARRRRITHNGAHLPHRRLPRHVLEAAPRRVRSAAALHRRAARRRLHLLARGSEEATALPPAKDHALSLPV